MDLLEPWRNAPPARYTLESDSEEEQDPEDIHRRSEASRQLIKPEPKVHIKALSEFTPASHANLLVAIEEAGTAWAAGLNLEELVEVAEITLDGQKIASVSSVQGLVTVFAAGDFSYESTHSLTEQLFSTYKPSDITIISDYSISAYVSSSNPAPPSIRYLATKPSPLSGLLLQEYEPPNLVSGLAAALVNGAVERSVPALLLLFPSHYTDSSHTPKIQHSNIHRQLAPEAIYDYGGPSPNSSSPLTATANQAALRALGDKLQWPRAGWEVPNKEQLERSFKRVGRKARESVGNEAGFGWWRQERRLGEREIGEGGMYL